MDIIIYIHKYCDYETRKKFEKIYDNKFIHKILVPNKLNDMLTFWAERGIPISITPIKYISVKKYTERNYWNKYFSFINEIIIHDQYGKIIYKDSVIEKYQEKTFLFNKNNLCLF